MSKIKLEVGKAYVNRKGEEVRIVDFCGGIHYPYKGNKGMWYSADGRWWANAESPHDLIKEVPETRHIFTIPNGKKVTATRYTFTLPDGVKEVTVEQVGNRIVVEMVPEDKGPKPGDVMVNDWNSVYIFKSDKYNGGYHTCFAWLGESGNLLIGDWCLPGRPATPEEAQPLWDALKKAGKRWNPETMQVEEIPEIDRILEWVEANIEYRHYTKEVIAEAIEAYLKYREGEK